MFRTECSGISRSTPAIEERIFHSLPFCLRIFSFKGYSVFSNHTLYWNTKLPIPSARATQFSAIILYTGISNYPSRLLMALYVES